VSAEPAKGASPSLAAEPVAAVPTATGIDAETRYALGAAYKDMGLLEEAKEEFFGSMKDVAFFVDSCLMLALCLKEQNQSDHAIQLLEKVVTDSRCRGGNAQIVRYVSARDRAIAMYQSIPSFHDVPQRLEALCSENSSGSSSSAFQTQSPRYADL
jgi:Tetratricopeptide repeat